MGKKGKKPGRGKEKTEKKTAIAEEKKSRRESKKISEEDDIDAILFSIQKEEAKKTEVHVEENVPAPSPRSNCSLCINPLKEIELIHFGGEFYNGSKTFVYGDLYRFNIENQQWKLISSPNSPPPRSAHQAVVWKNYLYIFGGEFTSPNQERFHHYRDFWELDLKTNQWKQIKLKGCPSPRSGHRMVLYKHKIIVFGGFYDTLREVRYFNDLYIFDLDEYKWQEVKPTPGCMWPSARSGFQLFAHIDEIFLYGGYSKEVSCDKNMEKGIVHSDMWSLDPRTWVWNKVKKRGMPPGPRAVFSMCVDKKRALLFGGVVDMEVEGEVIASLFLNEMHGFQFDGRRWYPMELRKEKSVKDKSKKTSGPKHSVASDNRTALDLESYIANDIVENLWRHDNVAESVEMEGKIEEKSLHLEADITVNDAKCDVTSVGEAPESDGKPNLQNAVLPGGCMVVKPLGRINCCMVVGRDTLYIYGGMLEVNDREVTLDDLYALNLSKLDEWKCIIPASKSEWEEASEGEMEDEEGDDSDVGSSDNGSKSDVTDDDDDVVKAGNGSVEMEDVVAMIRGEGKGLRRKEKRARIEQIRATLGLSDSQRTPMPGESLRDFYRRTNLYWQMTAHEHFQHTGKELRKDGFDLAEGRYRELKPILDELALLEAEQKAEEAEGAETNSRQRGKKQTKR